MKKITVEEHIVPRGVEFPREMSKVLSPDFFAQMVVQLSDVEQQRLPEMDQYGIEKQVLSLALGLEMEPDAAKAVAMAKTVNDGIAEVVRARPTRFAGLAAVPFQNPKEAADELERAIKQLGLKGAMINGHVNGEMVDLEKFWPVWERAEALKVPVYLHPGRLLVGQVNKLYEGYPEMVGPTWNWAAETGGYTLRLMFSGLFDAFPGLTLIIGHMGETIPYVLWRLDSRAKVTNSARKAKLLPSEYVKRNILITTSGQFAPEPLACAISTVGADRILFAVDYPFERTQEGVEFIDAAPISETDRAKICYLNAERVFGL